ncbi:MAG: cell division protein FtsA [Acidobacteriales bacterium]|nr:cell division protein FtsA [Terriglobales bacterium]
MFLGLQPPVGERGFSPVSEVNNQGFSPGILEQDNGLATNSENLLTVIDVGSAKTCVLVGETIDGSLRYRGHGISESRGSRKGAIVDLEKASSSIHRAVEEAEKIAGATIDHAVVTMGGPLVRGLNSRGGLNLGSRPREITREDVRQASERARSVVLPADREMMHLLPQEYIVDQQSSIRDPLGMIGMKLEVSVHIVTAGKSSSQNVVTAANRAGIQVDDTIFEGLASAEGTLKSDERELGICLLDIGAGSTDLIVYFEGAVAHTGVVPIGGDHFTNDVAVGLRTPLIEAEKIKRLFGNAVVTNVPESNEIEVPAVGERPSRLMPQRLLSEILEPRARELFEYVRDNLRQGGVLEALGAGSVLTGGGARLAGLMPIAESVLRSPSRIGRPATIAKMPMELSDPEFATAVGSLMYANRSRVARSGPGQTGFAAKLKAIFQSA